MQALNHAPQPVEDEGESPSAGVAVPSLVSSPTKSSSSSGEEDRITKVLLADARSYIISDTSLRNILGESISIGEVYTRSYSSTMVNGTNRSRCQISFEVNGSRGGGKGTLIANQEDIIKLDVDIGNDVIEVNVRSQRPQGFNVRDIRNVLHNLKKQF